MIYIFLCLTKCKAFLGLMKNFGHYNRVGPYKAMLKFTSTLNKQINSKTILSLYI